METKTVPKTISKLAAALALAILSILDLQSPTAHAQTTAFTYQGRLDSGGNPANGTFDLQFAIWDSPSGGALVAGPVTNSSTSVSNGLFTVTLDFGAGVFTGAARWLEIGVRTNGGGAFTTLAPSQALTATPYAMLAGNISGVLANSSLPASPGFSGTVSAGSFAGSGAGLTNLNAGQLTSGTVPAAALANAWKISGNAGTAPGTHFVGTTDNQSLELKVNAARALILEPRPASPNVVGGHAANNTAPGVAGAAIAGGGQSTGPNTALGSFAAVGGGYANLANQEAVVGGGMSNRATGLRSVVSGGALNQATNGLAVVSGGALNVAGGIASVVAGGGGTDPNFGTPLTNSALGHWSVVSGGRENTALGESATISGGERNEARGNRSTASGGVGNQALFEWTTVGGGAFNQADFPASTVSGGQENAALNQHATVGGGVGNYALGDKSTIGGGANNLATGPYSVVPGGQRAGPTQYGQLAHAAGYFMNPGDAQRSVYVLRALTDVATPLASLTLDGGPTRLKVELNRSLTFDILLVARAEPPFTDTAGWHFRGVVKDAGGIASFVGTPTSTTLGNDVPLWTATLALVGDVLTINVNGGGGGGYPAAVRWVARVDAAHVAW